MTGVGLAALVAALLVAQLLLLARPGRPRYRPGLPGWATGVGPALVVGALLRLAWVTWATRTPHGLSDPAEYLRIADGLAHGQLPVFISGEPTAIFGPGYSLLLAPLLRVTGATGGISPAFLAALVNTVGGVATIALTAFLADRWIGTRARVPAAWIMAVAPAQIYWTSTAHTESVFTALSLGVVALITVLVDRRPPSTAKAWSWVAVGAVLGLAVLVRSPGLALLPVPALAVRARAGSWAGAARPSLLVLAGALVVLTPWAVRNGVQVGVWTPTSTGNAAALCAGHHDEAEPYFNRDPDLEADCFRRSPYDDERLGLAPPGWEYSDPDEALWYREASARGVSWALSHPLDEGRLATLKFIDAWRNEDDAVAGARNYDEGPNWPGRATFTLGLVANLWLWAVEALAFAALVLVPAARRALPIWGLIAIHTVAIMATLSFPHYRHPAVPLLVVLASGVFVRSRTRTGAVDG